MPPVLRLDLLVLPVLLDLRQDPRPALLVLVLPVLPGPRPVPVDEQAGRKSYPAAVNRPQGTYEVQLPPGKYRLSLLVPPKDFDQSKGGSMPPPVGGGEGGPEFEFKGDTVQDISVP